MGPDDSNPLIDLFADHAPNHITAQAATYWKEHTPELIELLARLEGDVKLPIPPIGEEFELALYGKGLNPMEVVELHRRSYLICPDDFSYTGAKLGPQIRRFRLIEQEGIWEYRDMAELCTLRGWTLSAAQWAIPFMQRYPRPDGSGDIGFGGIGAYFTKSQNLMFPYLGGFSRASWKVCFALRKNQSFPRGFRWLVEVPDSE